MSVYILLFCYTCRSPLPVPYVPSDCQVISVHRDKENANIRAWEHCEDDHECIKQMYVETIQVEP